MPRAPSHRNLCLRLPAERNAKPLDIWAFLQLDLRLARTRPGEIRDTFGRPLLLALICNMFLCNSLSKEATSSTWHGMHFRVGLLRKESQPSTMILQSASFTRPSNRFTKTLLNCGSSRNISYIACASASRPMTAAVVWQAPFPRLCQEMCTSQQLAGTSRRLKWQGRGCDQTSR